METDRRKTIPTRIHAEERRFSNRLTSYGLPLFHQHLLPATCHLLPAKSLFGTFFLASAPNFCQNTSIRLDEALLAWLS